MLDINILTCNYF